jgi:DNA processing protein
MSELLYKIGLSKIAGVGAVTARQLVSYCGSAKAVFEASKKELIKIPNIGTVLAEAVITQDVLAIAEKEIDYIAANNIKALTYTDAEFPQRLKFQHDCPFLLFYKGNADVNAARVVGIVGTRKPTTHGEQICKEIIEGLLPYNVLIISGLAYGIDITAHKKSLEMEIPNIGAVGHGLSHIYPTEHHKVAEKMVHCGGLLSEHTHDIKPDPRHFPMRNRLIAGMCDALLVVETALSGGSMISAELAFGYDKDVFAVPGRSKDKYSQGCNFLIKNNKAALVETAEDLANSMNWEVAGKQKIIQTNLFVELTAAEQKIYDFVKTKTDVGIDDIGFNTALEPSQIAINLLQLEFKNMIKVLPGKRYSVL